MSPIVALTTDFGFRDAYVAQLKGVLLSLGPPDLRIVDLSHELKAFDVHAAALFLRAAVPCFPPATIHLTVVDPGVGSERRAIAARAQGQSFVGPDNGVFGYVLDRQCDALHEIDPVRVSPGELSSTFHGRDLFAPAAAMLAQGRLLHELGPAVDTYQHQVFPMVEVHGDTLSARVLHIDAYGNLITNVPTTTLQAFLGETRREDVVIQIADRHVFGIVSHYAEVKPGQLLSLLGSSGLLEIAAREASAAEKLGAEVGASLRVTVR